MVSLFQNNTFLWVGIITLALLVLQITFGFLMRRRKKAFIKYHPPLGVLILLIVLFNLLAFPVTSPLSIIVLILVLVQVTLGFMIWRGNKSLIKYHRPLGLSIFILVLANLILLLP